MSNIDLIGQCFYAINTFKRHRALTQIKRAEGKHDEANFHELKQYQYVDNLELGLRALQRSLHDLEREKGEDKDGNTTEDKSETN